MNKNHKEAKNAPLQALRSAMIAQAYMFVYILI